MKNLFLGSLMYDATIMFLKIAILLQWIRTLAPKGLRDCFFWTCQVLICIHAGFYTAGIIVEIWSCNPRERIWNKAIKGTCINTMAVNVVSSAVNAISDTLIFI